MNSLTKGLCGFGTDMGGVVIGRQWSYDRLMLYRPAPGDGQNRSSWSCRWLRLVRDYSTSRGIDDPSRPNLLGLEIARPHLRKGRFGERGPHGWQAYLTLEYGIPKTCFPAAPRLVGPTPSRGSRIVLGGLPRACCWASKSRC